MFRVPFLQIARFSGVFASVSDVCFKCFICLLLYVTTVASACFKSISVIAHGMHVGSGTGPLLGRSLTSPTTLGHSLARAAGTVRTLAPRIGRPDVSKSVLIKDEGAKPILSNPIRDK